MLELSLVLASGLFLVIPNKLPIQESAIKSCTASNADVNTPIILSGIVEMYSVNELNALAILSPPIALAIAPKIAPTKAPSGPPTTKPAAPPFNAPPITVNKSSIKFSHFIPLPVPNIAPIRPLMIVCNKLWSLPNHSSAFPRPLKKSSITSKKPPTIGMTLPSTLKMPPLNNLDANFPIPVLPILSNIFPKKLENTPPNLEPTLENAFIILSGALA